MGMQTPDTSSPPVSPYLRHPFPWVPQPFPHASRADEAERPADGLLAIGGPWSAGPLRG
jgi:hypothetical protein